MSTTAQPQRSLNITTRGGSSNRGGRRTTNQSHILTADQKHQFELVQSIKPEWSKEQVTQFCEELHYDGDLIEQSINQLFEFDRPAHSAENEEWKTINTADRRKAEGSPTGFSSRGRGARGGRGGARVAGSLSDRSIAAQSATEQKTRIAATNPALIRRDTRGSSPTNEVTDGKKKYQKIEKPADAPQVQLPVAGKSYAASLGLAKPAVPAKTTEQPTKSTDSKTEETIQQDKPVAEIPAAVVPAEQSAQPSAQPEPTPAPVATAPTVAPVKTAAQIVAAGPKKPAAKQPVAAPAPAPVAAPVTTPVVEHIAAPAVVSDEKNEEPKAASQSTPSPSGAAAAAKTAPARMWRKKESTTSSPSNAPVTAASPEPITAAEPVIEQPATNFATAPLTSLSQSIQAALKPASPQVRPTSPQKAPKSPAHIPAAVETHTPAPSSSPIPQSVADLLSAHDAVILPQHLRTIDADVQFGFGGKSTGPRAGGPRAPQPKTQTQAQPQVSAQPASPALNAHSQAALGSFPQTMNASRFPGSTSPLIHGLNTPAEPKAVAPRAAGVAGLTPSTPQNNLPLSSTHNQTPQTQASMDSSAHADDYSSLQNQQELHNDYSQHNESHDETGLANNLAHLSTSTGYTENVDQQYNFMSGMDTLSSPQAYDPNNMGQYGYEQFPMNNDYSMYAQSGYGTDQYQGMNYQQRNMGPNKGRGGFIPQQRGQVSQNYGGYRGAPQNYQQPINKPQSNMQQQQKKYQQTGPGAIQQQPQQQQQTNPSIGRPPVNQTAKPPQSNTVQGQNAAPQQMMNTSRPVPSSSPQPNQYNDYTRQSFNKQNAAPGGQQPYATNTNAAPGYNTQPKQAPHSPQGYKSGPKGYTKPNYPQQQQQQNYTGVPSNYSQGPYTPFPYYAPPQYPQYANQYPVGNVSAGPPGFAGARGYAPPGVPGFGAPFHAQSGYSSPQQFAADYDPLNDYSKHQYGGAVESASLVDSSTSSAQSVTEAGPWQQSAPKKVVGPESDPAAQRLGPYQNFPMPQQAAAPYNHIAFAQHTQQHQPLYNNPQYQPPQQQQPQQPYQHGGWQPHM